VEFERKRYLFTKTGSTGEKNIPIYQPPVDRVAASAPLLKGGGGKSGLHEKHGAG
jgi:hypothetical protein